MPPQRPKIYHTLHVDRLASVIADGCLWCDAEMLRQPRKGTSIGMHAIKERRLTIPLGSHPGLQVGDCVPFYFCARSVMLYFIWQASHPKLDYRGGEGPIVHLEADLRKTIAWAAETGRRWAFTLSNAGAHYVEDRSSLEALDDIDWDAVDAYKWFGAGIPTSVKDGKQAEFLVEHQFPWLLCERIGVTSRAAAQQVAVAMEAASHRPVVEIRRDWFYGAGGER